MTAFDIDHEHVHLTAHVTKDLRGLNLIQVYVTMNRSGYPKHARVNTEGGLTYIITRDGKVTPTAPTFILNEDEARIIESSLRSYLFGPEAASAEDVRSITASLDTAQKENCAMRTAKKTLERKNDVLREQLDDMRRQRDRYMKTLETVNGILSEGAPLLWMAEQDGCE